MSTTTFDTISISGNSSHKGLSYFYNPVKIESSLNVHKNLSVFGKLESNSFQIGSWEFNEEESGLVFKNDSQFSNLKIGNNLTFSSNAGIEKLTLGNFSILDKFKETQLLRNDIPIISFSKDNIQLSCRLKCNEAIIENASLQNLNINGCISVNQLSLKNDLVLPKETPIVFSPSNLNKPTLGTRSIGSKIILFPSISDKLLDYSIGLEQNGMWFSLPMNKDSFKWNFYAGSSESSVFSISGKGDVSITGNLNIQNGSGKEVNSLYKMFWTKINDIVSMSLQTYPNENKQTIDVQLPLKPTDIILDKNILFNKESNTITVPSNYILHFCFSI